VALRLIASRLLFGRLPQLTLGTVFVVLADVSTVVSFLVLVELARKVFGKARRTLWITWSLVLLSIGAIVLATWGRWPAWKTIHPTTWMALLSLLQMLAQKGGLLTDVLTVTLGILVVSFGRRYGSGWRSHAQQIIIGLSTASLAQLAVQALWQVIASTAKPHSMAEYDRIVGLREKLFNGNSVVYLAVAIWWIVCLWLDEPGSAEPAEVAFPVGADEPAGESSAAVEPPEDPQE
jgi:hypothetical protein